jgi:hypothetical protein
MPETPTAEEIAYAADVELMRAQGHAYAEAYEYASMRRDQRKAAAKPEPRRAKLNLSALTVANLREDGSIVLHANDDLRGPVEIVLDETSARWLRACVADMGPLSDD